MKAEQQPETLSDLAVLDGHNDSLLRLATHHGSAAEPFFADPGEPPTDRRPPPADPYGHVDLQRCTHGQMVAGLFALFVPPRKGASEPGADKPFGGAAPTEEFSVRFTCDLFSLLYRIEAHRPDQFAITRSIAELDQALASDRLAAIPHLEGAEPIDAATRRLDVFYQLGLRSLGLVWSRPNVFGHGVPFRFNATPDIGPGLTEAGRLLVRRCEELGIVVDLAHINAKGFWDTERTTTKPLVVSHTCAHALAPTARNLTDDQIRAVRDRGGVIGLSFHTGDLRADGKIRSDTPLPTLANHLDHLLEVAGEEHVAFGSDFDGALMPRELPGADALPKLLAFLHEERSYSLGLLHRIAFANWHRVLAAWWST